MPEDISAPTPIKESFSSRPSSEIKRDRLESVSALKDKEYMDLFSPVSSGPQSILNTDKGMCAHSDY